MSKQAKNCQPIKPIFKIQIWAGTREAAIPMASKKRLKGRVHRRRYRDRSDPYEGFVMFVLGMWLLCSLLECKYSLFGPYHSQEELIEWWFMWDEPCNGGWAEWRFMQVHSHFLRLPALTLLSTIKFYIDTYHAVIAETISIAKRPSE